MLEIKDKMIAHKIGQVKEQKRKIKEKKGAITLLQDKIVELDEKLEEEKEKRKEKLKQDPSLTWAYVHELDEKYLKRKKNIRATITRHKQEIQRIRDGPIKTLRQEMEFFKSIKEKKKDDENKEGGMQISTEEHRENEKMEEEEEEEEETIPKKKDRMVDEDEGEEEEEECEEEGSSLDDGENKQKAIKRLVESYGAKMAHLIYYIRKICKKPQTRIIIFSQWDRLLHRVGETLEYVLFPPLLSLSRCLSI